jgi:hypothetical protein
MVVPTEVRVRFTMAEALVREAGRSEIEKSDAVRDTAVVGLCASGLRFLRFGTGFVSRACPVRGIDLRQHG